MIFIGCNRQIVDFNWIFNKAYCKWPDGTVKEIEISSWRDYENSDQIQIKDKSGKVYLFHSANVVLVSE